jgi:hypothetical protein
MSLFIYFSAARHKMYYIILGKGSEIQEMLRLGGGGVHGARKFDERCRGGFQHRVTEIKHTNAANNM